MKNTYKLMLMLVMAVFIGGCGVTSSKDVHITSNSLPSAHVATPYVVTVGAAGGMEPYTWSLKQGRWPTGVELNPTTGTIAGAPTELGDFPVTVGVQDSSLPPQNTTHALNLKVSTNHVEITTTSLPSGAVSAAYSSSLVATNGIEPYTWKVTSGRIPPGLTLQPDGQISGTPSQLGAFSLSVQARDSSGNIATGSLGINILAASPTHVEITTTALPSGAVSVAYSSSLIATNGIAPYTWSVVGGQLPTGLSFQTGGQISGTPSLAGTFSFSVQAKDSSNQTASASFSANIGAPSSPVVRGISPSSGPISGGMTVTISGANFTSGATVTFGGAAASSVTVSSSSQILAVTPSHIAGSVGIIVQVNGQSSSSSSSFTYSASTPTVSSISPNNGPTAGGTKVTITGTNFLAGALVLFGNASASSIAVNSATQIQAVTPPNATGVANVTIQDPGNLTSALSSGFTYTSSSAGTPTITSVSPTSGAPGTTITITGTNFASADTVAFGSKNAASTIFVSSTQLTATVPTISSGTYSVTVTDPDPASVTLNNGFTVTAAAGGQSLLSGCSFTGSGGCSVPSGWTLVAQQDFECSNSHAVPANPACATLPSTQDHAPGGLFETTNAHSGTYGFGGSTFADGNDAHWQINQNVIGSFTTVYISYWEYTDPNAQYGNSDYYLFHMVSPTVCGGAIQDIAYDAQPSGGGGAPPVSTATMLPVANGNTGVSNCQGYYQWANGSKNLPMMAGQWRQVEILYTPSTTYAGSQSNTPSVLCTSSSISGCGNGSIQLFINGQLSQQSLNADLNGDVSMANSDVEVGGVITDFCDAADTIRANPFTICPSAAPTAFNRYSDDIIIMKH